MTSTTRGRLAGKKIVISGALGGIGLATCRLFLAEGAEVLGADLGPPSDVPHDLRQAGERFSYEPLDVSQEDAVASFSRQAIGRWGGLDVLFNNAGIILGRPLGETTVAEWDRLFEVNGRGTFLMTRAFAKHMGPGGSIINMASGAAARPLLNMAAYGASKAAIVMFTKTVALELAPIRVNVLLPGTIDTPMPRKFVSNLPPEQQTATLARLAETRALKRLGLPEEIAEGALFLASDASSYMTGAELNIDGGRM
jgi:NAD(P)-dependent dehydrogenase (short-subunit alcohol dehydrogenase family)